MFAQERLDRIVELLNENGKVVVKDLSKRFNVTEDCIRKDLKGLERQNIIQRTYGGAVLRRKSAPYINLANRRNINLEGKKRIAEKAFKVIEDRETIFLDISTSNLLLAERIAGGSKKLTVITNMIDIMGAFAKNQLVEVIGVGGKFHKEFNGFVGSTAIENILKYKVDRAFIGSCGVDIFDKSVTTTDLEDASTKKAIINSGKKVYLVMESGKFYFDSVYKFADIYDVDAIIVDEKPDDKICNVLKEIDIEMI